MYCTTDWLHLFLYFLVFIALVSILLAGPAAFPDLARDSSDLHGDELSPARRAPEGKTNLLCPF
jgi:hypothetical protein